MSDLKRRLAELEAQLAALERRSPSACCPTCRLPTDGEAREAALHGSPGGVVQMILHWSDDPMPPEFCASCRGRITLPAMRLTFHDDGDPADLIAADVPAGPWEGDE